MKKTNPIGINALTLRCLALILMLLDHLWGTVVPGNDWMNFAGRIAFPIFAFQIAEGYFHTRNFRNYCKRLLIFGLVSEIPFNLMIYSSPIFPFHQNVMFTLLLGLLAIRAIDQMKQQPTPKKAAVGILKLAGIWILSTITFPDYGTMGVINVVTFYLLRNIPCAKLAQFIAMVAIHWFGYEGRFIPITISGLYFEFPVQAFAILSLIPIWLYNGEKGPSNRYLQYGSYLFYPLHMLILYFL